MHSTIDQDCMVFVSQDKTRFVTFYMGPPCFSRSSHDRILALKGVDLSIAENVTAAFHFTGKGRSVKKL